MAGAFPLPRHRALDLAVRAHLDVALAAERDLAGTAAPERRAHALAVLARNGALRTLRREARSAAGVHLDDGCLVDGSTWDAPDIDGGFG
jgi:hypothetical protein